MRAKNGVGKIITLPTPILRFYFVTFVIVGIALTVDHLPQNNFLG